MKAIQIILMGAEPKFCEVHITWN